MPPFRLASYALVLAGDNGCRAKHNRPCLLLAMPGANTASLYSLNVEEEAGLVWGEDINAKPCMRSEERPRERTRPQAGFQGLVLSTYAGCVTILGLKCNIRIPVVRFSVEARNVHAVDSRSRGNDQRRLANDALMLANLRSHRGLSAA